MRGGLIGSVTVALAALLLLATQAPVPFAPASAQEAAGASDKKGAAPAKTKKKAAKKAKEKPAAATPPAPATAAQKEAYAALPVAERIAIQSDLVWTGDFSGGLETDFGDRAVAAVRAFQRRNKLEETGILTPDQRQLLANATRSRKEYVGWRLVEDTVTPGVRLGVPTRLVPQLETGMTGSRWSSARGEIQVETFREKMAGTTLAELFEEMKRKPPTRRLEHHAIQNGSFVLSGMQGLKKFHVRVFMKDNEARGLTILFDQAMEGIMLPLVDTITNAYLPFGDAATSSGMRKIEYGSGIAVTSQGHIVTARALTENCRGLVIAGLGRAERLAEDKSADVALLRVHGVSNLKPLRLSSDPPNGADLTLLGIAEPDLQAGARKVSTAAAKLRGVNGTRVLLDAAPARGFVGGAALDAQGRFVGMIDGAASNGAPKSPPAFIPTATIRKFLDRAGIAPADGGGEAAAARESIVRVICVRT